MRLGKFLLPVLAGSVLFSPVSGAETAGSFGHWTLGVFSVCKDGYVIMFDREVENVGAGMPSTSEQKIRIIDGDLLVAVTGVAGIKGSSNFMVRDWIMTYLMNHKLLDRSVVSLRYGIECVGTVVPFRLVFYSQVFRPTR